MKKFLKWLGWYDSDPQTFDIISGAWNYYPLGNNVVAWPRKSIERLRQSLIEERDHHEQ